MNLCGIIGGTSDQGAGCSGRPMQLVKLIALGEQDLSLAADDDPARVWRDGDPAERVGGEVNGKLDPLPGVATVGAAEQETAFTDRPPDLSLHVDVVDAEHEALARGDRELAPRLTAVGGGPRNLFASRRPAVVRIREVDAEERGLRPGLLRRPGLPAVGGREDDAELSDGPAALRGDEVDVVEEHVAGVDALGRRSQIETGGQRDLRPGLPTVLGK